MKSRLFCNHCDKYFEVDIENIRLVQEFKGEHILFAHNTYFYNYGCFFKELNKLKRIHETVGNIAMAQSTLDWLKLNDYKIQDINMQGSYGNTALMKASREGNAEIVHELLKAGADINVNNVDGNKAIWLACFGENPEVVKLLIDEGIEIDTINVNGVTPLMYAASSAKEEMVEMLLEAGADVKIKNHDDFTALDLAVTPKILKMMRERV